MRLLLISNSTLHGSGYLQHCTPQIHAHLEGRTTVAFVPYALADHEGYAAKAREAYRAIGLKLHSVHECTDPSQALSDADAIFIGGGNTFRLLKALYDENLLEAIREGVRGGMAYVGTSAGSNVACAGIHTTNDMPIVCPPSLKALDLVPFNINPHYLDPDPTSTHMGETRELRIAEFHEESDRPVLGLREGAMLRVADQRMILEGSTGARLFRRGEEPVEYEPGADLSFLLKR